MNLVSALNSAALAEEVKPFRELVNQEFYYSRYPDVQKAGVEAWVHYLTYGMAEDRQPRGDFDPNYYRTAYQAEIGAESPFRHWIAIGREKGLVGHPWINDPAVNDAESMLPFFDAGFYLDKNADIARTGVDPFEHFVNFGWKENRDPNNWFKIVEYVAMNDWLAETGINPFSHYVLIGRELGLMPAFERSPDDLHLHDIDRFQYDLISADLDAKYYISQLPAGEPRPDDCVVHYIREGAVAGYDPNNWFSTRGYLANNEDVRASGVNPLFHYLCEGVHEGRSYTLNASSNVSEYSVQDKPNAGDVSSEIFSQHLSYTSPGPNFEALDTGIIRSRSPRAKLITYYLPQFHSVPENDAWWGLGFTEWRNVIRGQPRYRGHQQPRVPEQLGFYDLSNIDVMKKQIELARSAGIYGFCFYYYNFNGRRILEKPVDAFLAEKKLDFPFTIMWANENWTRTWDGLDRSVLLQQDHKPEGDRAFLADIARHFADERYMRIDGRPLFFIYRPGQVPQARQRFADWRSTLEKDYGEKPLIFMAQGFDDIDPRIYDLDGAIEFPPHKVCKDMQPLNAGLEIFDPSFTGHVISYAETIERSLRESPPDFPLIKAAVPSWDNEARRPGRGMTLQGATPSHYERWLRELVQRSDEFPVYGERIVAVNAWNEWAEGAYLEPDAYNGAAYLNATARALVGSPPPASLSRHQIVIVGHDAYRHGAQLLVRNLADVFSQRFGFDVHIVVCGDGPLLDEYRHLATTCTTIQSRNQQEGEALARRFISQGINRALVNTTVSGWIIPALKSAGFRVTALVHELPQLISEYGLQSETSSISSNADVIVFPADLVRDAFLKISGNPRGQVVTRPQGLYRTDIRSVSAKAKVEIRERLGLPRNAKVVINVGYADMRKGFDIFLRAARTLCAKREEVFFVWVGSGTQDVERWLLADIRASAFGDRVFMTGYTEHVADYYAAADAFFLTSREDPFPSVVLEALAAELPIVATRGLCGTNSLVENFGVLVDVNNEAEHVAALERALKLASTKKVRGRKKIEESFRFDDYCFDLARNLYPELPKISVIVPNYNYAQYLESRLHSIFRQTHPVFEVIVLDDLSSDNSISIIRGVVSRFQRKIELVENRENSGSVFKQWRKGLELARGDYVWIAEADDDCDERFLQSVLARMVRDGATVGFSDSWQMGSLGERLGDSYRGYLGEEAPGAFEASFSVGGHDFAESYLSIKNVILNVSGAVFSRRAMMKAFESVGRELYDYKVAGDWRLYVELCAQEGSMFSYVAQPLNGHRRHHSSVTHSLNNVKHYKEIREVQRRAENVVGELSDSLKATRAAYLIKVKKYLGIQSDPA
ncbi:glycoside hydrolase family 99-like domain-containing protein [Bosea sp. (in: a-proteobacteria)]|uniref:glycoside hydrolase family 99-like domain-containing protein n=1 Tax=Bosea sp. (in: a-proteobacteria) TaxID=1871050 RepID=UPI002B48541B|nr:glycoside hydrolase family 99-like domain-containing protein [Bosea sp. (in: a-proteobacteria)]WRH57257.1 MAG: glycoside hydrolase family 99-like domain-containing protein [Bosea sp. (in: a-proteobacteria)]